MASSTSDRMKFEVQAAGENSGTWGDTRLNNALKRMEEGVKGHVNVSVAGSDVTLTSTSWTPGAAEYCNGTIGLTAGGGVGARNIIVPAVEFNWHFHNATGYSQTIKTSGGTGAAIPTGYIAFVYCDGTDCYAMTSPLIAASGAQMRSLSTGYAISTDSITAATALVALTDASTVAVDWTSGLNFTLTIGGNRTLGAPTNGQVGTWRYIIITQDGTGSRTLSYNAVYKRPGGSITLSTAAGAKDTLSIFCETTSIFHTYLNGLALA